MLGWRIVSYLLSLSSRVEFVVVVGCRCVVDVVGNVDVGVEPVDSKECSGVDKMII
jgi:hypothetical protein